VTFSVPLETDVEAVRRAVLDVAQALAPAPEGIAATVDVEELRADHVTLRINAWASEPLQRRRLASDLRAAVLRRLLEDGLVARPPGGRP
jgi:small-conductance mechanosensitive channel